MKLAMEVALKPHHQADKQTLLVFVDQATVCVHFTISWAPSGVRETFLADDGKRDPRTATPVTGGPVMNRK